MSAETLALRAGYPAGAAPRVAAGDHKKTTVAQQEVATKVVEKIEKENLVNE